MNDEMSPTPHRWSLVATVLVVVIVVLAAGGWAGWRWWQQQSAHAAQAEIEAKTRWDGIEQALAALRRDQRATNQRAQDAASTNRVLRDEMLALSQRGTLLEDTVAKLADPKRHGAQALRLDEVELLLNMGQQRLAIAGDLDGARHAYKLAASTLDGIDDPSYLNLRQTLIQERNALDAVAPGPASNLPLALDKLGAQISALPVKSEPDTQAERPWWQKLLSPLVRITPSRGNVPVAESSRMAARDALQIELTLARAAIERNDSKAYRASLQRVDSWLVRLWPDSGALRALRSELSQLRDRPLRPDIPELGTTLTQLRSMRDGRTEP